jgi:hypothetical protein
MPNALLSFPDPLLGFFVSLTPLFSSIIFTLFRVPKRTYQSRKNQAQASWSSLNNEYFGNKCTYFSGSVGTYTTRSANMKNSASTYAASNNSSTQTCASKNKSKQTSLKVPHQNPTRSSRPNDPKRKQKVYS